MMTSPRSLKCLLSLGILLVSEAILALPAAASPACDAEFMTTLRSRAWREAQREITTAATVIYKPDSVFALSCFGSALSAVPSGFSQGSNTSAASSNVSSYLSAAFNHTLLRPGGNNIVSTTSPGSNSSTSSCGLMQSVWNNMHCANLTDAAFANMAFGTDGRANNVGSCSNPGNWSTTATRLGYVGVIGASSAGFDSASLFLRVTDPLSALTPASTTCNPGIPTGVTIGAGGGTTYPEKVCPNPGCVPILNTGAAPPTVRCCDQNNVTSRCEP